MGGIRTQVIPVVEVEDIFVNKAMRSMQLKLRECIVYPPAERVMHRASVLFPGRMCSAAEEETAPAVTAPVESTERPEPLVVVPESEAPAPAAAASTDNETQPPAEPSAIESVADSGILEIPVPNPIETDAPTDELAAEEPEDAELPTAVVSVAKKGRSNKRSRGEEEEAGSKRSRGGEAEEE